MTEITITPKEGYLYPPDTPVFLDLEQAREWARRRLVEIDVNGLTLTLRDDEHPDGVEVPWGFCTLCGVRTEALEPISGFMACEKCKGELT